eukprot:6468546-Amphidinium_carterae.3
MEVNTRNRKSKLEWLQQVTVAGCYLPDRGGACGAAHDPPNERVVCGADVYEKESERLIIGVTKGGELLNDEVGEIGPWRFPHRELGRWVVVVATQVSVELAKEKFAQQLGFKQHECHWTCQKHGARVSGEALCTHEELNTERTSLSVKVCGAWGSVVSLWRVCETVVGRCVRRKLASLPIVPWNALPEGLETRPLLAAVKQRSWIHSRLFLRSSLRVSRTRVTRRESGDSSGMVDGMWRKVEADASSNVMEL